MPRIEEMYAFIAEESGPDDEGVIAIPSETDQDGTSIWLPLIGADMERAESLRDLARGIANEAGKKVTLVRFSNREDVEIIN